MTDWIDGDEDLVGSQYPFSAMATVDLIRGNLNALYEQSPWALQIGLHEETVAGKTCTTKELWYVFDDIGEIGVLARRSKTGWRALKITAMMLSDGGDDVEIRWYAFPGYYGPATPDSATGYGRGYASTLTDSTSYTGVTATLSAADVEAAVYMAGAPAEDSDATATETARVVLVALVSAAEDGEICRVKGIHIEEVAS